MDSQRLKNESRKTQSNNDKNKLPQMPGPNYKRPDDRTKDQNDASWQESRRQAHK